jgi:hypothetical protein
LNMPTSPNNKCLSLPQLQAYFKGNISPGEKRFVEEHILSCSLCSAAIEGYSIAPFSSAELEQSKINVMKRKEAMFSTRQYVIAVVIAVTAMCVWFYQRSAVRDQTTDSGQQTTDNEQRITNNEQAPEDSLQTPKKSNHILPDKEVAALVNTPIKTTNDIENFGKKDPSALMMPQKEIIEVSLSLSNPGDNKDIVVHSSKPDTFIHDLKITAWRELYYTDLSKDPSKHTDAKYENKDNKTPETEDLSYITTAEVLDKALDNFSKNNFTNALKLFNVLIKYEPKDVNALFYASVCYISLNRAGDAMVYLDHILEDPTCSFYEEAQWEKAQALIQLKKLDDARSLLEKIISADKFYAKRAGELLTKMKGKK